MEEEPKKEEQEKEMSPEEEFEFFQQLEAEGWEIEEIGTWPE